MQSISASENKFAAVCLVASRGQKCTCTENTSRSSHDRKCSKLYAHTTHISSVFSSFLPTACICKSPSDEFYITLHARERWFWCLVPKKGSGQGLCRHADFSSLLLSPRICLTNKCYNPPANYWLCTLSGLQHRRKRLFYCCWEKMQIEFTRNTPNVFYELWCPVPGSAQIKMCLNLVISVCIHYTRTKTFPHTCRACV